MSALLPQLEISTYYSQIFWLLITFSILYFSLSRVFLPNIANLLQRREEYIEQIKRQTLKEEETIVSIDEAHKNLIQEARDKAAEILHNANNQAQEITLYNNEVIKKNMYVLENDMNSTIKNTLDHSKTKLKLDCEDILEILLDKMKIESMNKENLHNLSRSIFEQIWADKYRKFKN
jgi:F-type H+-transporting ATPase subunit b